MISRTLAVSRPSTLSMNTGRSRSASPKPYDAGSSSGCDFGTCSPSGSSRASRCPRTRYARISISARKLSSAAARTTAAETSGGAASPSFAAGAGATPRAAGTTTAPSENPGARGAHDAPAASIITARVSSSIAANRSAKLASTVAGSPTQRACISAMNAAFAPVTAVARTSTPGIRESFQAESERHLPHSRNLRRSRTTFPLGRAAARVERNA